MKTELEWISFDGTENTLPRDGVEVIYATYEGEHSVAFCFNGIMRLDVIGKWIPQIGDRWAYLTISEN